MGLVGTILPFENKPEHQGGTERREGINLTLDGAEPKGVTPRVGQCTANAGSHDDHQFGQRNFLCIIAYHQAAHEVRHRPEQQQNGGCAQQRRHRVDGYGRSLCPTAEDGHEKSCSEHEYRVARRVSHFELKALRDEFRAVPETCRRLYRKQIGDGGDGKTQPSQGVVD
ncbi:unknown [Prevotella sp. CAG:873]|nr:unknown [Prevotella sp. CAG:873]